MKKVLARPEVWSVLERHLESDVPVALRDR
jgi:hypothetical protein